MGEPRRHLGEHPGHRLRVRRDLAGGNALGSGQGEAVQDAVDRGPEDVEQGHVVRRSARLAETDGENCGGVGSGIDLHKSTISHHYRVLREAGVTLTTIEGRSRVVRLRRDDLEARFPGLLPSVLAAVRDPAPGLSR